MHSMLEKELQRNCTENRLLALQSELVGKST